MMKKKLFKAGLCLMMAGSLGSYTSCQDDLSEDEHYKRPDFLKGSTIDVLQKDGNYKTFLKGIELIEYTDVVSSQILTILAPTDDAFAAFLKEKGYNSIEEMYQADPLYTQQVITYHMLYYAMGWDKMTNFRPNEGDGATELEKNKQAGMYNRFRTRCKVPISYEFNDDPTVKDTVPVIHRDRYLTVFSEKLFATLGIDAASNYNFFFPNTTWNPKHLSNGFNVMNAAVLDTAEIATNNGYLYHIDHVLEPKGTIYEELKANGNYQKYLALYDSYATYAHETNESKSYGYKVYEKSYTDSLPSISSEWPNSSYVNFTTNSFKSWNLFIPTDEAMNRMFSEYWSEGCGYTCIEDLNPLIQKILVQETAATINLGDNSKLQYMSYADLVQQGKVFSKFGSVINPDLSTYDIHLMCNNGAVYGSSKMETPGVLSSVVGPVFKDTKYLHYLYALQGSGLLLSRSSQESKFVALIPDTAQFTHHDPAFRLFYDLDATGNPYTLQQWNANSGDFAEVSGSTLQDMANMNTTTQVSELKIKGTQVIETDAEFNYWYVHDGKITTNALFNELLTPDYPGQIWADFREIKRTTSGGDWSNGRAYAYDYKNGIYMPASGTNLETQLSENNDRRYPYYCFVQLLKKAGLVDKGAFVHAGDKTIRYTDRSSRFFIIIPTNDAIKTALKTLPGCSSMSINESTYAISGTLSAANKALLADYLLNYFVTYDRQPFLSFPYVGSSCKGQFQSAGIYHLNIDDNGTDLRVKFAPMDDKTPEGNEVQLVSKYYYLPFAFSDGAFQLIDEVLK